MCCSTTATRHHPTPPPSPPLAAPAVSRPSEDPTPCEPPLLPSDAPFAHEPYAKGDDNDANSASSTSSNDSFMEDSEPPPTTTDFNAHYPGAPATPCPPVSLSSGNSGALRDLHGSLEDTNDDTQWTSTSSKEASGPRTHPDRLPLLQARPLSPTPPQ